MMGDLSQEYNRTARKDHMKLYFSMAGTLHISEVRDKFKLE